MNGGGLVCQQREVAGAALYATNAILVGLSDSQVTDACESELGLVHLTRRQVQELTDFRKTPSATAQIVFKSPA